MDFLARLFDSSGFVPRRICGDWSTGLILLHNLSDGLIWLSYIAIPFVLVYFIRRRSDMPFPWIFWLFGAFIVLCGTTHLMEVVLFYWPHYRLAGLIKLATAIASLSTVIALVPITPVALAMRNPRELEREISGASGWRMRSGWPTPDSSWRCAVRISASGNSICPAVRFTIAKRISPTSGSNSASSARGLSRLRDRVRPGSSR